MERARAAGGERGHEVPEPLLALQQQSAELIATVVPIPSGDDKPEPPACPRLLLRQLEQMKRRKFELENRIRAGEMTIEDFPEENLTKEYMTEGIVNLEKEIEKMKVAHHNKSLLLQRMQLCDAIHNKLLEKNRESQLIYNTMEHSKGLCSQIFKSQQETITLEAKWIEVRKRRMELKETCTKVLAELRAMKESENNFFAQMDDGKIRKINKYIAKEIDIVTVIQNVFQRLILGSSVNWAEDPKLKETVLKLGQNPASS